jgi:hypothetical protein
MRFFSIISMIVFLAGCQKSEVVSEFTGRQAVYALVAGSTYNVNGTITFKQRKDGNTTVVVDLTGTDGDSKLPVHLHLGDISKADADVALLLSPVASNTGQSETNVSALADESKVTYQNIIQLAACVKIHLAESGAGRSVILAAGNIGSSTANSAVGWLGIGVCKSN